MLRDRANPYYAVFDPDSGRIMKAQVLGLLTSGVGTARTGLAISQHQLGFTPPADTIVVRQAGESTTGSAENAFSLINRFPVSGGPLRGLVVVAATIVPDGIRGYNYTPAAAGNRRKIFRDPDELTNNLLALYGFKLGRRVRASLQVNVTNVFDAQKLVARPRNPNGTTRYFAYQYSPHKTSFTNSLTR